MAFNQDFVRGSVETIVLHLLRERTMYGYEIIKIVNERTNGAFAWKEGTLYPCLHRLEGAGVIASEWCDGETPGKPRKYYRLTRKGEAFSSEKVAEWQAFSQAMGTILCQPA
ncbi:MAG TPA: PadR family transcriptional regulator [Armatimonadota bacterium]|nr:PadR family transcriptional regulator [Armatimonadota bacterium]